MILDKKNLLINCKSMLYEGKPVAASEPRHWTKLARKKN
jgi:hypothetical protein